MVPIVAGAISAAKGAALSGIAEGIGSLFGGETGTDRERKARAASLLSAALNGDTSALRQLTYDAFERKQGLPGDSRKADGNMSPKDVRDLALKALKSYMAAGGKLPTSLQQYASRIGAPMPAAQLSDAERIVQPIIQSVGDAAVDAAAARAADKTREALPYILMALAFGALVMYASSRKG